MKNKFKKFLCYILTLALTFSLSLPSLVSASENDTISNAVDSNEITQTIQVNEFDYIKKIQSYTLQELLDLGYTKAEAKSIYNYDFNKELLDLAEESTEALEDRGFSSDQINKIVEYDGSTDAIAYSTINSLSSATLTVTWGTHSTGVDKRDISIYFSTTWSQMPLYTLNDIVACGWVACNSSSIPLSMKVVSQSCTAFYYQGITGSLYVGPRTITGSTTSQTGKFKFALFDNNYAAWAKTCSGTINLSTQSNSANLYSIQVDMGYGHTVLSLGTPEVSFSFPTSVSVGLSFNYVMQDLYNVNRTFRYDSTILY